MAEWLIRSAFASRLCSLQNQSRQNVFEDKTKKIFSAYGDKSWNSALNLMDLLLRGELKPPWFTLSFNYVRILDEFPRDIIT